MLSLNSAGDAIVLTREAEFVFLLPFFEFSHVEAKSFGICHLRQ